MLICKTRSEQPKPSLAAIVRGQARAIEMDAGDWIALGGVSLALVIHSVGVAIFLTRVAAQSQANTKAIEDLYRTRISDDQGKGYQAQLDRLERGHAECDGRIGAMRQEFDARTERLSNRVTAHEQQQSASTAALTASLAKFEATFTAGLQSLKEAIDRLHAERAAGAAHPDFITQLQQFAAVQKMLKGQAA